MPCWSSSEDEEMTVGEANRLDGMSRSRLWTLAVVWPVFILAMALCVAYALYRCGGTFIAHEPWRVLASLSWAPYLMLASMIVTYMDLSLPLAPVAARRGLFVVVMGVGGAAFALASLGVAAFGHASAAVALAFALALALAGLVALWVWVDRVYRAVDS